MEFNPLDGMRVAQGQRQGLQNEQILRELEQANRTREAEAAAERDLTGLVMVENYEKH